MKEQAQRLVRSATRGLFRIATRIYIDRLVVKGIRNLPVGRPFILAGNHPSGLLDALVLMSAFPKIPMSGVGKDSLFKVPIVGSFLRVMRAVPVAKAYDPDKPESEQLSKEERAEMNRIMFETVEKRLIKEGINISIFPEGTCTSRAEVQELKTGTARMAIEVAMKTHGKIRVPIVPIGLSYSEASGKSFRSSVLVDVGRPVEITDQMLDTYMNGDADEKGDVLMQITNRLETHLRHITIAVPDWRDELWNLCKRENLVTHDVSDESEARNLDFREIMIHGGRKMKSTIEVSGKLFQSDTFSVPKIRGKYKVGRGLLVRSRRQASRRAFFEISGAQGYDVFQESDQDFVENIHLSRRIYKPDDVNLTLGEYAALSRNFMHGYLRTGALKDPAFRKLWQRVQSYRELLYDSGLTDKFVVDATKKTNRDKALRVRMSENLIPIVRTSLLIPIALFGTALHMPLALMAYTAGRRFGVDEDGDESTVATVAIVAGFGGILLSYPAIGCLVWFYTGSFLKGSCTVAMTAFSGMAAAEYSPIPTLKRSAMLLTKHKQIQNLAEERQRLKSNVRDLVDKFAPPNMKGWWKKTKQAPAVHVTASDLVNAGLCTLNIPLQHNKRNEHERAALTIRQREGNDQALIWIPGRNDSFYHVHILDRLLRDSKMDLFALDLRRCGRAKVASDGVTECVPPLLAHDSNDFEEYFEELDAVIEFLKRPGEIDINAESVQETCCGRHNGYRKIVMYAHSTGALVAALYENRGQYSKSIDGYIFNSPFWEWNQPWYENLVLKNSTIRSLVAKVLPQIRGGVEVEVANDVALSQGGGESDFSLSMHKHYKFSDLLKSRQDLTVTAGWASAVTNVQRMIQSKDVVLKKPALLLYTDADTVLCSEDIDRISDYLTPDGKVDGRFVSMDSSGIVERKVETSELEPSSHDVLAAPSKRRVDEAMRFIVDWCKIHFPGKS